MKTLYIKLVNPSLPGCEVNLAIEGDCAVEHRRDAANFAAELGKMLCWPTVQKEITFTDVESDIVES